MGGVACTVDHPLAKVLVHSISLAALIMSVQIAAQTGTGSVLSPAQLEKMIPATVYYAGQTAPTQLRNSGGVKFPDGHFTLLSLVDTSGYSTGVAAKYQGYLIAEVPIRIGGKQLSAGAYGFGFLSGDRFLITDLGANDVFTVNSENDASMKRPRPLQVVADPSGGYRIYSGRTYVHFNR